MDFDLWKIGEYIIYLSQSLGGSYIGYRISENKKKERKHFYLHELPPDEYKSVIELRMLYPVTYKSRRA